MRLEDWEIEGLIRAVENTLQKNHIPLSGVRLYLYGSRIDDKKKGGDIDLLLRTPEAILMAVKKQSISLNTDMQNRIGEQKIDLLIVSDQPPQDPFHEIAIEQAVLIKAW